MKMNLSEIITKENALRCLLLCLKLLNLLPRNGNGRVELIFQNNVLLDTVSTNRIRVNYKVEEAV